MERSFSREKIDCSISEEYQKRYSVERQRSFQGQRGVFGAKYLHYLDQGRRRYSGEALKCQEEKLLNKLRDLWCKTLQGEDVFPSMRFWEEMYQHLDSKMLVEHFLAQQRVSEGPIPDSPHAWHVIFRQQPALYDAMPLELWEQLTRSHVQIQNERQRVFENDVVPQLLAYADQKISHAIQEGTIPITLEAWEKIREDQFIHVTDSVLDREGSLAAHNYAGGIKVSGYIPLEEQQQALIHEFIHAFSGTTVQKEVERIVWPLDPETGEQEKEEYTRFDHQRSGL